MGGRRKFMGNGLGFGFEAGQRPAVTLAQAEGLGGGGEGKRPEGLR